MQIVVAVSLPGCYQAQRMQKLVPALVPALAGMLLLVESSVQVQEQG